MSEKLRMDQKLLDNVKGKLPDLKELLAKADAHWGLEDDIYRLYHHSFKVYSAQPLTMEIVNALKELDPKPVPALNADFLQIISSGTGRKFEMEHNARWLEETLPIIQALFHARYFLQMGIKYGEELEHATRLLPNGWALFLYLYNLR